MDYKEWYLSKGIWGAIMATVGLILFLGFGIEIKPEEQTLIIDQSIGIVSGVLNLVGIIMGLIGRVSAKAKIG